MPKVLDLVLEKLTLGGLELESGLGVSLQDSVQCHEVSIEILGVDNSIVEIRKSLGVRNTIQYHVHQTRIRAGPAGQAKGHSYKLVATPGSGKGRLGLVLVF